MGSEFPPHQETYQPHLCLRKGRSVWSQLGRHTCSSLLRLPPPLCLCASLPVSLWPSGWEKTHAMGPSARAGGARPALPGQPCPMRSFSSKLGCCGGCQTYGDSGALLRWRAALLPCEVVLGHDAGSFWSLEGANSSPPKCSSKCSCLPETGHPPFGDLPQVDHCPPCLRFSLLGLLKLGQRAGLELAPSGGSRSERSRWMGGASVQASVML